MIFIPFGVLDKLPLSPRTKHILGRVRWSQLFSKGFAIFAFFLWKFHVLFYNYFILRTDEKCKWCGRRFNAILRFGTHASGMPFGDVGEAAVELSRCSERQQEAEQLWLLSLFLIRLFFFLHYFSPCISLSFPLLFVLSPSVIRDGPWAQVALHVL